MHAQTQQFLRLVAVDSDLEVRQEASLKIAALCACLDANTLLAQVLPVLRDLTTPPASQQEQEAFAANQLVREAICSQVSSIAPILGRDATLNELMPLMKTFFNDEQVCLLMRAYMHANKRCHNRALRPRVAADTCASLRDLNFHSCYACCHLCRRLGSCLLSLVSTIRVMPAVTS